MPMVKVSVLMPAYNAERYLRPSITSVLDQTFENFELLVVNDASTDGTAALLASIRDPRLRVLCNSSNLGIVGSLNRALGEACGQYIARTDADDICYPARFAQQVAFLDNNPDVGLVGTRMANLEHGQVRPSRRMQEPDPAVLRWLLHISNPVGHPSMMFRAAVARKLDVYLRQEFLYAEDFDFSHQMLRHGTVAVMAETLMLYRLHDQNASRVRRQEMISRAAAVLGAVYENLLGRPATPDAITIATHLFAGMPIANGAALRVLGATLDTLLDAFLNRYPLDAAQRARCELHTAKIWWRTVEASIRSGAVLNAVTQWSCFSRADLARPALHQLGNSVLRGVLPGKKAIRQQLARLQSARHHSSTETKSFDVNGALFTSVPLQPDDLPSLTIVVDTEAEFDWTKPFDRSLTTVHAMAAQEQAQAIFDGFGLRPIYVVDYAVATQPEGYEPLRRILARHGCAIGAHLHPWITPPFEETVNDHNSYGGNLPPALEEAKLRALVEVIERAFGVRPLFFKAGRYGLGPHTLDILARMRFEVDFSIMPLADYRDRGGADFRFASINTCRSKPDGVTSVPMTRSQVGALAPLPPWAHGAVRSPLGRRLHLPGLLSRLKLANTVTLTPEGVTTDEQIALLRDLAARGHRRFVLHYHSPSLVPGNTPYVRTQDDLREFKQRLQSVCQFFFEDLGGLPGHPADLLAASSRDRLWPEPAGLDLAA